mmetsp:Transcript_25880/g.69908  ORF Transcript_25880/g.69908 Transcript_25880/m.69908 type:complete len:216 (-) Transcript_25880:214-861(-)
MHPMCNDASHGPCRVCHHGLIELDVEGPGRPDPHEDHCDEDAREVGRRGCEGAAGKDEALLDEGAARLAHGVANHVHRRLALGLALRVQGDVGHLLARVEEGVLGRLGEDVLRSAHEYGKHERGHPEGTHDPRLELRPKQGEPEEESTSSQEYSGRGERGHAPPEDLKHALADEHHDESHGPSDGAEHAHELRVVVRVGEGLLELGLPRHLHNVD